MSGIPLPALAVRPPEQPDLLGQAGKVLQLRQAQQGIQENDLALQQKQRQMQDQQTIMQVAAAHNGNLVDSLPELAGKISAATYVPLQKSIIDTQKAMADKTKIDLENEKAKGDQLLGLLTQAKQLAPDQYQAAYPQIAAQAMQIEPKLKLNPQQPIPQQYLDHVSLGIATQTQLAGMEAEKRAQAEELRKQVEEQRKQALAPSQLASSQADAAIKQSEANAIQTGGINPKIPLEFQEANAWLNRNPGKTLADYQKYKATLVPAFNFSMNASGGGLGPSATAGSSAAQPSVTQIPPAIRGRVQAILDYHQALPPAGRQNPINNAISEWVYKLDPQHDEVMFPARNKMMTAMTSGKEGQQINAVNTALGHVGVLNDAIDALQNHDTKILNSIGNRLGLEFGTQSGDATAMFNTIVHRVGPELAAAYIQGGGGEGERGTTAGDFDANLAPSILHNNTAITANLLRSKIGSLENQYKQTMQKDDFQTRFLTPEARATLEKLSPQQGGGNQPAAPSRPIGATHTGVGSVDKKKHWLDAQGNDLGIAE
jgi:hypothetical protein